MIGAQASDAGGARLAALLALASGVLPQTAGGVCASPAFFHYLAGALALAGMARVAAG